MQHFDRALFVFLMVCLVAACASTQQPAPIPHWEHLPPPHYGGD